MVRGQYGCGDHKQDLEGFIFKNQLEARVAHALRTMSEPDQKRVMGTDGGENSYVLIDRVKNPNGVVMSRIRRLEKR
jgi:muramoyltetrapeptide carboxypeptidase LdcA involved in peptidoglycan recycling